MPWRVEGRSQLFDEDAVRRGWHAQHLLGGGGDAWDGAEPRQDAVGVHDLPMLHQLVVSHPEEVRCRGLDRFAGRREAGVTAGVGSDDDRAKRYQIVLTKTPALVHFVAEVRKGAAQVGEAPLQTRSRTNAVDGIGLETARQRRSMPASSQCSQRRRRRGPAHRCAALTWSRGSHRGCCGEAGSSGHPCLPALELVEAERCAWRMASSSASDFSWTVRRISAGILAAPEARAGAGVCSASSMNPDCAEAAEFEAAGLARVQARAVNSLNALPYSRRCSSVKSSATRLKRRGGLGRAAGAHVSGLRQNEVDAEGLAEFAAVESSAKVFERGLGRTGKELLNGSGKRPVMATRPERTRPLAWRNAGKNALMTDRPPKTFTLETRRRMGGSERQNLERPR